MCQDTTTKVVVDDLRQAAAVGGAGQDSQWYPLSKNLQILSPAVKHSQTHDPLILAGRELRVRVAWVEPSREKERERERGLHSLPIFKQEPLNVHWRSTQFKLSSLVASGNTRPVPI